MIEVTGIDLRRFAREVYKLSPPTGDVDPRELLTETVMGVIVNSGGIKGWRRYVLDMKVVKGRACNMTVFENNEGRWFIQDTWPGHSRVHLKALLAYCGVKAKIKRG